MIGWVQQNPDQAQGIVISILGLAVTLFSISSIMTNRTVNSLRKMVRENRIEIQDHKVEMYRQAQEFRERIRQGESDIADLQIDQMRKRF
jgi:coproporphyrinogen III oxidase-like Fe-S oxidoreductase